MLWIVFHLISSFHRSIDLMEYDFEEFNPSLSLKDWLLKMHIGLLFFHECNLFFILKT